MSIRLPHSLALTALLSLAVAAPASAHTQVRSTSPSAGQTAKTSVRTASVTFTGQIRSGTLRVTDARGRVVSVGRGARDSRNVRRIRVELRRGLRAGGYRARWVAQAADGHTQRGSFSFRLR